MLGQIHNDASSSQDLLLLPRHSGGELGVPDGHVVAHGDQLKDGVLLSTVGKVVEKGEVSCRMSFTQRSMSYRAVQ